MSFASFCNSCSIFGNFLCLRTICWRVRYHLQVFGILYSFLLNLFGLICYLQELLLHFWQFLVPQNHLRKGQISSPGHLLSSGAPFAFLAIFCASERSAGGSDIIPMSFATFCNSCSIFLIFFGLRTIRGRVRYHPDVICILLQLL